MSFVFTIVIVMYHAHFNAVNVEVQPDALLVIHNFFEFLASIAMAYFFMVSGYLLYYNASEENVERKLKTRFHSLIIPFLIWNVIYMLAYIFVKDEKPTSLLDLVGKFSFYPYDGPLWYVFAIFLLALFIPLGVKLRNKTKLCIACLVIVFTASVAIYCLDSMHLLGNITNSLIDIGWIVRFVRYLPAYCIGAAVGILKPEVIETGIKSKAVKAIGCLSVVLFLAGFVLIPIIPQLDIINGFIFMNGIIFSTAFIWVVIPKDWFANKSTICKNSFFIYASHSMIIAVLHTALVKALDVIGCPLILSALLVPVVCALAVYITALACTSIMKKIHCEKIMVLLTGGR